MKAKLSRLLVGFLMILGFSLGTPRITMSQEAPKPVPLDTLIQTIPDSLAVVMVVFDANMKTMNVFRRNKTVLRVPLHPECSVAVIAVDPFDLRSRATPNITDEYCESFLINGLRELNAPRGTPLMPGLRSGETDLLSVLR